jgi:hypothetical protein
LEWSRSRQSAMGARAVGVFLDLVTLFEPACRGYLPAVSCGATSIPNGGARGLCNFNRRPAAAIPSRSNGRTVCLERWFCNDRERLAVTELGDHECRLRRVHQLARFQREQRDAEILLVSIMERAAGKAREFFLQHRLYRSSTTGKVVRSSFAQLSFPPRTLARGASASRKAALRARAQTAAQSPEHAAGPQGAFLDGASAHHTERHPGGPWQRLSHRAE